MNARKVAARFAAYTWYEQSAENGSPEKAARFSRDNWKAFLPVAEEGLGKLLLTIAQGQPRRQRSREQLEKRRLVMA